MHCYINENTITPIIEFYPIEIKYNEASCRCLTFEKDTYSERVKKQLEKSSGIYVFYDSAAKSLYLGKAVKQNLWDEMNNAYNRQLEELYLVDHPSYRNVDFKAIREIKKRASYLYEMACYVSAYSVAKPDLIDVLEAFCIRCFANDLLNIRMEKLPCMKS